MTTVRDDQTLSNLDLVVLARLSGARAPSEATLGKDVAALLPEIEREVQAREVVTKSLPKLRKRRLVNDRKLTEDGGRALRTAFGLDQTPTWAEVRDNHLPALALGLKAGSVEAARALTNKASISAHLVCDELGLPKQESLDAVSDALIMKAFEIPRGPLTLTLIRAYALAKARNVKLPANSKTSPAWVAAPIVTRVLDGVPKNKDACIAALRRYWVYVVIGGNSARTPLPSPRALELATLSPPPPPPTPPVRLVAPPADTLLTLVREAIPKIGSDGRFGKEKVFVSAIWQRIERDNRLPDLSLDRFKSWLVSANRDQLLDLARADLVGAMDPRLVRESEIEDLGATFHFVVDRRASSTGQGHHAR